MRYIFMLMILCFLLLACQQAAQDIPDIVKNSFKDLYQDAEDVEWEKENGNFEVEFEIGEEEMSVLFDEKGNVIEIELDIKVEALPDTIRLLLAKDFGDHEILEAVKIVKDSLIYYEVELEKDEAEKEITFAENGSIFHLEAAEEKNEDE